MEHYLSLKDHVYRYISDCINTGSLNPGDKINEAQVSETLNISRTPIREALVQLASDGYLDSLPRKGFRVKALDTTKVQQFYEIIGALDGRAAALCMPHITKEDLNQMQFLAEAMDSAIHAGLGDKYYELQVEFHNVYLNRCPNTEMTDLLNRLKNNFIRKYYLFENPDNENSVLEEANQQHYEDHPPIPRKENLGTGAVYTRRPLGQQQGQVRLTAVSSDVTELTG